MIRYLLYVCSFNFVRFIFRQVRNVDLRYAFKLVCLHEDKLIAFFITDDELYAHGRISAAFFQFSGEIIFSRVVVDVSEQIAVC